MADTISYRFRLRRRLAAAWAALNEVLLDSEIGLASDTRELKIGDGTTPWNTLPWLENGMQLSRAGDVDASAQADGMALVWNSASNKHIYAPAGGGGDGSSIVGEATVTGSPTTSITVSGLDLAADGMYLVQIVADNATASTVPLNLYVNGDSTAANYYTQIIYGNGAVATPSRVNSADLGALIANEGLTVSGFLMLNADSKPHFNYTYSRMAGASLIALLGSSVRTVAGNVNSLTLTAATANALAVGTTLRVLRVGGSGQTAAIVDPDRRSEYFDDFLQTLTWVSDSFGSGAGLATVDRTGHDGVINFAGGTTTTGYARMTHGSNSTVVPRVNLTSDKLVIEAEIALTGAVPDATNTYAFDVGLRRAYDTGSLVCLSLRYDSGSGAARWGVVTRNNASSQNVALGSSTPVTQTWYRVRLEMTTSEVKLYVNGVLEVTSTATSTFPDSGMAPYVQLDKSAGTATRGGDIDWFWLYRNRSAPRQTTWP